MQILRHFLFCIGFIFCNNFTVQYHGFEKSYVIMMSGDICRGDWRIALREICFKKLRNDTNSLFCRVTSSKNDIIIFAQKGITIYTVYCMFSDLSDAPCNNFQFFLFWDRSVWYKSKQCQMLFNKQICGGISFCKPPYCSIWHLEAQEYFGLCGNKAFSETMMWVNFFWTAPSLIIGELLLVVKDWAMNATVEFRGLWLHIRKDAQVCDASAGVSLEEIQQRVFE